ncbi:nucleoside hydrolase [Cohnella thailandensis]|uniref:Nucleoside hydrolase n=1 Tax=Cohnella thailandensis TaxID=557557 RepID=A0A841T5M2_9BACL|nr:nucleoside hydrolase [Cohnella thailandensis]MBB6637167.1 nucleoside hydrolase [Cohnella thailandensis]MBP1977015.1 inosine-uridine nucleoside N-ribohydrolase [Cohnella thailandensis]
MKLGFDVPDSKKIRLIVNSDAKNEADDQYAIVHALLTPQFIVKGLIGAHFGELRSRTSMLDSVKEIELLLKLMGMSECYSVMRGAERALQDELTPAISEGAELIVQEAMSDDQRPLFVIFLGAITDLATAYLMNPAIADRLTAVWIGGGAWPDGGAEFNLGNDVHAANVVLGSPIPLWQIPRNVYSKMRVSLAELKRRVEPCGAIGRYLYQQLIETNQEWADHPYWPRGEMWTLGDSPAVGLLMHDQPFDYDWKPAPRIAPDLSYVHRQTERQIRVYRDIDARFILEDMYAKLELFSAIRGI